MLYRAFRVALCLTVLAVCVPKANAQAFREYDTKAMLICMFLKFTSWENPAKVFKNPYDPIRVGILGEDPFPNIEGVLRNRLVRGRNWEVVRGYEVKDLRGCQVIFVSRSEAYRTKELLEEIDRSYKNTSIITIGDQIPGFCQNGGMFNFTDDLYKTQLNIDVANEKGILIRGALIKAVVLSR